VRLSHRAAVAVAGCVLGGAVLLAVTSVNPSGPRGDTIPQAQAAREVACATDPSDVAASPEGGCGPVDHVEEGYGGANWTSTILGYFGLGAFLRYTQRARRAHG
jgi:hypothetical protein